MLIELCHRKTGKISSCMRVFSVCAEQCIKMKMACQELGLNYVYHKSKNVNQNQNHQTRKLIYLVKERKEKAKRAEKDGNLHERKST